MNAAPDKPEISAQEASWIEHLAGMRARAAACKQGSNPEAVEALATATSGPVTIANRKLYPASQGTVWTLQRLAREFSNYADFHGLNGTNDPAVPGERELLELGLATLCFCNSRECWKRLELGKLEELILESEELMWSLPIEDQLALQAHFAKEMDRINRLSPDASPGKFPPAPPNGNLQEMQTHAEGPEWPRSNGCAPSMESV